MQSWERRNGTQWFCGMGGGGARAAGVVWPSFLPRDAAGVAGVARGVAGISGGDGGNAATMTDGNRLSPRHNCDYIISGIQPISATVMKLKTTNRKYKFNVYNSKIILVIKLASTNL